MPTAPANLPALAQALRKPHFALYLGRKSCPLALPLDPRVIAAASVYEAFDSIELLSLLGLNDSYQPQQPWPNRIDRQALRPGSARYYWEDGMTAGMDPSFQTQRHDRPLSRRRWQFAPRREWVALSDGDPS